MPSKILSTKLSFSIFILLLLYEASVGNPITGDHQIPSSSESQVNSPNPLHSQVTMSIWARKAGGHLKPEYLRTMGTTTTSPLMINDPSSREDEPSSNESSSVPIKNANPSEGQDVNMKMEDNANFINQDQIAEVDDIPSTLQDSTDSEYESSEEKACPEDQFWHIRGEQCVPIHCPGGNQWRDTKTGVCILRNFRKGRRRLNKFSSRGAERWTG